MEVFVVAVYGRTVVDYHLGNRTFANVCREHGIDVPKQISILGVDNDGLLCEFADQRFREIEGSSIHRTIEDRRMELAEKALSETNRPLRLIARESGYKSVKTFEAAFRKRHGTSPGLFRRNN